MRIIFYIFLTFRGVGLFAVDIVEEAYQGRPHFIIYTKSATYYYDKNGGGFTSILDEEGIDWIAHSPIPDQTSLPEHLSRGLPNLVILRSGAMAGAPGSNFCTSEKINKRTIRTSTRDGEWIWSWSFYKHHAKLSIKKIDPDLKYWFSYHGLVAGRFHPEKQYWGTNLGGPRQEFNTYLKGEKIFSNWHWAYFGDYEVKRVFFVAMEKPDKHLDTFSYKDFSDEIPGNNNGMVIFGFGRKEEDQPLLCDNQHNFYIGFVDQRVTKAKHHLKVQRIIEGNIY